MATSVKVDERTKDKLEELQAEIRLETGRKVTQQALLDRIVTREFDDQGLSFTDATILAHVEEHDIDSVLTFDDDLAGLVDRLDPANL